MNTKTKSIIQISALVVLMACWAFYPAFATPPHNRPPDNRPPDQRTDVDVDQGQRQHQGQAQGQQQYAEGGDGTATATGGAGGEGGAGGNSDASAGAEASASAGAEAGATGGNVGDITIEGDTIPANTTHQADIELKNTPDIVNITPGSGDDCKAHIGANLSLPGLGTGVTIPLAGRECRKLKYYDRMIGQGDYNAAEIIFCSLKDVQREFRELGLNCRDTLSIYVVPPPVGQVILTNSEYDELMAEAVQKEEFEEVVEKAEYRYAQQQSLIEELQDEVESHETEAAEVERLKRLAAERAATRAKVKQKLLAKKEAEDDGSEDGSK